MKKETPCILKELLALLLLTLLFVWLTTLFWGTQGDPLVDRGRELYFPQMMLQGAVLYRDLFNHQGPLSYQLNSVFISLFSDHLNTYLTLAAVLCFSVLLSAYGISRVFFSRWASVALAILIMVFCFFSINRTPTPMFPYSYSIMYGLSFYMASLWCTLLWVQSRQRALFLIACLLMGASAISKIDFIGFIPFLIGLGIYYGSPRQTPQQKKQEALWSLFALFIIPTISIFVLWVQGLTPSAFLLWFQDFQRYTATSAQIFYATHGFFLTPLAHPSLLKTAAINGILFFVGTIPFVWAQYRVLNLMFSKKLPLLKRRMYLLIAVIATLILYGVAFLPFLTFSIQDDALTFASPFVLLSVIALWVKSTKHGKPLEIKGQCAFIAVFGCILGCLRVVLYLDMGVYGNYFLPLIILAMAIMGLYYWPRHFKALDSRLWIASVLSFFLLVGGLRLMMFHRFNQQHQSPFVTAKGTLHLKTQSAQALQETYDYLKQHIPPSARVFMIPDGPFFNYALGYPTDAYLFSLHPPHIDLYGGEAPLLRHFKATAPDYILLQNYTYDDYGVSDFKSYAPKIMTYIESAYEREQSFGRKNTPADPRDRPLSVVLYRHKPSS